MDLFTTYKTCRSRQINTYYYTLIDFIVPLDTRCVIIFCQANNALATPLLKIHRSQ